jgi:phosphoribosylglycinamide formyltransferase-1
MISGEGTNAENIIKKLHKKKLEVIKVISNKKDANGLKRAENLGVKTVVIESKNFKTREEFDENVVKELEKDKLDLVVLAGFMRILTPIFTQSVKAINIHPSLLPLFKGTKAIERSFESDMKVAGVSVHEVSSELDGGKIIAQECFNKENLSFTEFEKRIHEIEYKLYPKAICDYLKEYHE